MVSVQRRAGDSTPYRRSAIKLVGFRTLRNRIIHIFLYWLRSQKTRRFFAPLKLFLPCLRDLSEAGGYNS
jgi:hypothetical protein